jgi:Fur family ferric uptake transcriptional regulator
VDKKTDTSNEKAWEVLVSFLKDNQQRVTPERKEVLDEAFARHDHFTADELADEMKMKGSKVGRATVFRTLDLMVKAGVVKKIRDEDTHAHYEHILGHAEHDHMICDRCGKFIEYLTPEIKQILEREARKVNFKVRTFRATIFGICEICAASED